MNDFFQLLSNKAPPQSRSRSYDPSQSLRDDKGKSPPTPAPNGVPSKLHMPNRLRHCGVRLTEEELTVTHLRRLYSALLEEMAPLHHEIGTGSGDANFRWKNSGTVTVNGSDDEGYDYSYTPDSSKKSWRLQRTLPGSAGGGGGGVTGGDWSKDGIRRYYTGGAIERGGGGRSSNIISVGELRIDVGTINGVEISPKKKSDGSEGGERDVSLDLAEGDVGADEDGSDGGESGSGNENESRGESDVQKATAPGADAAGAELEEILLEAAPTPESGIKSPRPSDGKSNMTTFESLYHLSPSMAWRLRSAYAPKTPQEQHLISLGSEILAQRHPEKADGIMKGLEVARNCELKVCDGLQRMGELISYCEKLKGIKSGATAPWKKAEPSSEEDDDVIEAADALFAYFCEKNIFPLLIDSLLCQPPPLASAREEGDAPPDNMVLQSNTATGSSTSPFSGATWTAAVKAQILKTIGMILFNTSSTLSLTYLLSNNYMNELVMGVLPMEQWKEDSLAEILPPYVTLLRGLVMRLRDEEGSSCLPLFLCQRRRRVGTPTDEGDAPVETYLPLLYAAVQVFCSPSGASLRDREGCLVRTTAMNVILNLCRIADPKLRSVLAGGGGDAEDGSLPATKSAPSALSLSASAHPLTVEIELLFPYVCNSMKSWFHRSVRLVMASLSVENDDSRHFEAKAEAKARHKDIAEMQFRELQYWLGFLDDLLSCNIRSWNARLVEWFLKEVILGTVLLRWNISLGKREHNDQDKVSLEVYKARAEIRVSVVFLTQLFGMVEYRPLIRLVGAVVLNDKYPHQWSGLGNDGVIDFEKADGFFVVTPVINFMVSKQLEAAEGAMLAHNGEEADAGAGGGPDTVHERKAAEDEEAETTAPSPSGSNEMDHRALETVAAKPNFYLFAEEVETKYSDDDNHRSKNRDDCNHLVQNAHRASLLAMLACDTYSHEETMLASMLVATILENDAIDDQALEIFGVLPSPTSCMSPFETSIAQYLSHDWQDVDSSIVEGLEFISTLGLMLLERIMFHTWTEGGRCVDVVPFDHYYKSSKFVQALCAGLVRYVTQAQSYLSEVNNIGDIFSETIIRRYSKTNDADMKSPRSQDEPAKVVCSLQGYFPSNFIDNTSCLLACEHIYSDRRNKDSSTGDLFLSNENHGVKCLVRALLHLRSLVGCIHNFYQRFTGSAATSRWYGEGELLSFCTMEEADNTLLAIAGIEAESLPVGAEIDLRGRMFFKCSMPRKSKFARNGDVMAIIDANGDKVVLTEKSDLVFVVDPSEIYAAKVKREDPNRCTVFAAISLRAIIASATEGELLHIVVCNLKEHKEGQQQSDLLKNGTLSLRFDRSESCLSVKECLDKHCLAAENKIQRDLNDMLEACLHVARENLNSTMEDDWCDFQQA